MKTNQLGINLIKSFESCSLKAYLCPAKIWTIGWGHTVGVIKGEEITQDKADLMLENDLKKFEDEVYRLIKSNVNENQFSALVSFCYNCGSTNLQKSTLLKKVNINPDDETIEAEFLKWNKAKGKVLNGLTRRRIAESKLYFTPL